MNTTIYAVEGLTCGDCLAEVLETVHSLPGVTDVAMDLVTGGQSPLIVTIGTKLGADEVRVAVENAGFGFRSPRGKTVRRRRDSASTVGGGDTHPARELKRISSGGAG